MKVDFGKKFTQLNGDELKQDNEVLTLKKASVEALVAVYQDERDLKGEEKVRRYDLAVSIYKGENDIKTDDIVLIKTLIAKAYAPIVVGQAWKMLEAGASTK